MLLSEFEKMCTPFQFYSIGILASAYHPKVYKIDNDAIYMISAELNMHTSVIIFALKVFLVGITDVLGFYNRIKSEAFSEEYQRQEMGMYYIERMLKMRHMLRFKPRFIDTFLAFSVQAPSVMRILVEDKDYRGVEETKNIMLFCGVSVYTLFMACDAMALTPDNAEREMIWVSLSFWLAKHSVWHQWRPDIYFGRRRKRGGTR
jgi:hypothetical protein